MKIIIGNKRYSSWSLRGWLACKQSGLAFTEEWVELDSPAFDALKATGRLPAGQVPVLEDGEARVWESLAIIDYLAWRTGSERFWPQAPRAHALARSIATEMHGGFAALRRHCPMNVAMRYPRFHLTPEVEQDVARITALWAQARASSGESGPYLFGSFGAADIMYAPVVTRIDSYAIAVDAVAQTYVQAMMLHPWMREWIDAGRCEATIRSNNEFDGGVQLGPGEA